MDEYAYVVNVDGAVVRDHEYLLIERGPEEEHASGQLGFPGGKLEAPPGTVDVLERTVTRELHEEVGIEVGDVEYVLSSSFEADDGTPCLNVLTLCEYEAGEARPRDPAEVAAVHWMSAEEVLADPGAPEYTQAYVERIEAFRAGGEE